MQTTTPPASEAPSAAHDRLVAALAEVARLETERDLALADRRADDAAARAIAQQHAHRLGDQGPRGAPPSPPSMNEILRRAHRANYGRD